MGLVSSMISILFFSPSIEAMYEKRGGGISIGSTFLQTFIAISSGKRNLQKRIFDLRRLNPPFYRLWKYYLWPMNIFY